MLTVLKNWIEVSYKCSFTQQTLSTFEDNEYELKYTKNLHFGNLNYN